MIILLPLLLNMIVLIIISDAFVIKDSLFVAFLRLGKIFKYIKLYRNINWTVSVM